VGEHAEGRTSEESVRIIGGSKENRSIVADLFRVSVSYAAHILVQEFLLLVQEFLQRSLVNVQSFPHRKEAKDSFLVDHALARHLRPDKRAK
jgi:hypothetical protein